MGGLLSQLGFLGISCKKIYQCIRLFLSRVCLGNIFVQQMTFSTVLNVFLGEVLLSLKTISCKPKIMLGAAYFLGRKIILLLGNIMFMIQNGKVPFTNFEILKITKVVEFCFGSFF